MNSFRKWRTRLVLELAVITSLMDGVLQVPFRAGYFPERSGVSPGDGGLCLRRCAYFRWENCGCGVCNRSSGETHD